MRPDETDLKTMIAALVDGMEEYGGPRGLGRRTDVDCSMTTATELYWGSSGRGNPRAAARIRVAAELGYVRVTRRGRTERVSLTEKGLSLYP